MKMMMMNVLQTCIFMSLVIIAVSSIHQDRKVYIAYMGSLPEGEEYVASTHHYEMLKQITNPRLAKKSLITSYHRSFNGFAAYLSHEEQQKLAGLDGVISVFPSKKLKLHTTRSWDFLGLPLKTERSPTVESDTIVGVIDTGIWPVSESFNDKGYGPIPKKWKGECKGGPNFTCNRKMIGVRFYGFGDSARDYHGHGTHVASIIAGNKVRNANYYGLAKGTARGGVPSARLAMYKVCDTPFCFFTNVLRAFDDAIADGVDIISISMNSRQHHDFTSDPLAIGAFHAIQRDILTVNSAGNDGPKLSTIANSAPWIFTVAASSTDRRIVDKVLLGDGTTLVGTSINAYPSSDQELPLVYGKEVTSNCSEADARKCLPSCLNSSLIQQKVVLCDDKGANFVRAARALGCIVPNMRDNISYMEPPLAVAALNTDDINLIKTYYSHTKEPKVRIFKSEAINNPAAPCVASFSSRGPGRYVSDIIKPDVTAPGLEILAAFSPIAPPSESLMDKRSVKYSILSGTSVACPHVAAAAAYVRSFHPNWSPSAIKSALMTTASELNPNDNLDAEFAYGSGHIDPQNATDPGLVYETSKEDYTKIWSNMSQSTNASSQAKLTLREVNYPSMAAQLDMDSAFVVSFPRTVTNVGKANSRYVASIKGGSKLQIRVDPNYLQFTTLNQKRSFVVTVRGEGIMSPLTIEIAALLWTDGIHKVRSPILVYTGTLTSYSTEGASTLNSTGGASAPETFCRTYVILFLSIFVLPMNF